MSRIRCCVLVVVLVFFANVPFSFSQSRKLDSLQALLKTAKADTNRVHLLGKLSSACNTAKKFDEATLYAKEMLSLSEKLNFKRGINRGNDHLGYGSLRQAHYTEAIPYYEKAISGYEAVNDHVSLGRVCGNVGTCYYNLDLYPKSLEYFLKALKSYEFLGIKLQIAGFAGNVGAIYNAIGNNQKALEFYAKALKVNEEIKSDQGMAINLVCIGNVYSEEDKFKEAESYFEKALILNKKVGEKGYIANNLNNIGVSKINTGDYREAIEYLKKGYDMFEDLDDEREKITSIYNIGKAYIALKEYGEAEKNLLLAKDLSVQGQYTKTQMNVFLELSKLYSLLENYKLSMEYYKKGVNLKDSLFSMSNQKSILQKQLQFDYEKKEALTKADFIREQSLKQVEIERRKQAMMLLEKDNVLRKLDLSQSNMKLQEKQTETEAQKKQMEILNKDKLLQEAEALTKTEELERQKMLRNIFIAGAVVLLGFAFFILRSLSQSKKSNKIIERQKLEVENQKHIVEEKQKEIVDSINYAQRIQYAMLANKKVLDQNLQDYFLFFKPKDVVSGDFYWATRLDNGTFALVTADSTGHGVPGAIMSILNIACLNESVKADKLLEPGIILTETRSKVISHLLNDGSEEGGKDGMDCSLVCFNFDKMVLSYAAANNPVWIVREGQLVVLPADKMPIGRHDRDQVPFRQTEVPLHKGDVVYTFTDGYADQFGGLKQKKFKYRQLGELLVSIYSKPMAEQHDMIQQTFMDWKGKLEQIDDVCIIGIRV